MGAHRLAWRITYGEPGDLYVLHTCDVKLCVEPSHLFLGTARDNAADCVAKGRIARGASLNHPPQAGERNHNAKLTDDEVERMRLRYLGGSTQAELAREFGVTRGNVHCIVRGKSRP